MTLNAGRVTVWRWRVHDLECGSCVCLEMETVNVGAVRELECGSCDRLEMETVNVGAVRDLECGSWSSLVVDFVVF
ncbi:hypothetical protein ACOSQ3_015357 [Xanthoceras sorbifolium]